MLNNLGNGPCDPTTLVKPNDPRALYDAYYVERDFAARAPAIKAATLYTHGFEDANVKAQMIPDWFNAITAPKLGLFGHWLHQHPPRMDQEVLFLAWMDQYVKGKALGLEKLPNADVVVDAATHRETDTWPTSGSVDLTLFPDLSGNDLGAKPAGSSKSVVLDSSGGVVPVLVGDIDPHSISFHNREALHEAVALSGNVVLHVKGTLDGAANGYLAAYLYEENATGNHLITYGQVNLAHNADHTSYTPIAPGQVVSTDLPFRPTEHIFAAGTHLRLELRGVAASEATDAFGAGGVRFTFQGGQDGTMLRIPTLPLDQFKPVPLTATP
jgi:predicted acyl esterase